MKIIALGAAIAVAAVSTPALAQQTGPSFNGPRIEARVGWDSPDLRLTVSDGTDSISRSASKSGVTYGGEIGYDYSPDNKLVIGGYVGLEESTAKFCGEIYGEDRGCLKAGRNITAGARIGAVVQESFLLYGKGGYSNGRTEVTYRDYELILGDVDEGKNVNGFHLGAGVEADLAGGVYGRLEYVYSNYGKASVAVDEFSASVKPTRHQIVYGMGIRF